MGSLTHTSQSIALRVIGGSLGALLVLGFRTWRHSDARSQAQEQTLLVLSLIAAQVRHANPDSLVLIPQPGPPRMDAVSLLSGVGPQGITVLDETSGEVVWQDRVVIYGQAVWDPVQRLSRFGSPVLQVVGHVGIGMATLATLATNLAARPTTSPTSGSAASPSVSGR